MYPPITSAAKPISRSGISRDVDPARSVLFGHYLCQAVCRQEICLFSIMTICLKGDLSGRWFLGKVTCRKGDLPLVGKVACRQGDLSARWLVATCRKCDSSERCDLSERSLSVGRKRWFVRQWSVGKGAFQTVVGQKCYFSLICRSERLLFGLVGRKGCVSGSCPSEMLLFANLSVGQSIFRTIVGR